MKKRTVRPKASSAATTTKKAPTASSASASAPVAVAQPPVSEAPSWASVDPRTHQVVPYDAATNAALEAAFKSGKGTHELKLGGNPFTVVFSQMIQKNATGGSRKVIRRVPVDHSPPTPLVGREVEAILKVVEAVDKAVDDLEKNEENRNYRLQLAGINVAPIIDCMDRIIQGFKIDKYRAKYGCDDDEDEFCMSLQLKQSVPNYFANVTDQSIYQRKMLSLCGLRNLVLYGPEIFEEMRSKLFSGFADDYDSRSGPNKMRYFTGNAVDLDYVVLRCSDRSVLNAINAQRKKEGSPTFKNTNDLGGSETAKKIALAQSQELIKSFVDRFKLTPSEVAQRRLELDPNDTNIHVAGGNADRGRFAVWQYVNVGQSSFHVNVPNMPDVYGALLKAPFHLAKAMALIFARYPIGTKEFVQAMDDFYEEAVADSCFNAKWKAIEEFVATIDAKGTIPIVLAELQAANQAIFTPQFFDSDPDRKKELAEMTKLASNAVGRDPATGSTRRITEDDVKEWMRSQDDY